MKKILLVLGLIVVVGATAFALFRNKVEEARYRTDKVTRGDIVSTVTATGTVNAVTTVLVGTQVSGTIQKLYVDYNSPVKKGQLIAQIDPTSFQAQVEQAQANLAAAKANLEKAQVAVVDARRTMNRNKDLVKRHLIAQSEFDTSQTNFESAQAQVSASKAAVAQAQAALKTARTNLGYTRIVSPVDGVVVSRNVDVGQTVAASFQTPTLFTIAQDLTKMQIDTSVAEADIGKVAVSQNVDFTVDAYPDITFEGKVWQVRISPIVVQNVVTYDVVVMVENKELKLMPGMTANVSIIVARQKDALRVPNAALRFRPAQGTRVKPEKGAGVWILQNGRPVRVPVTLGISDDSYTQIVTGELKDGQEVVVESLTKLKQGDSGRRSPRMF